MMVAAAVDIKNHIWKLMGNLGHRIYFYRMPQDTRTSEEKQQSILKILGEDKSSKKLARCQKAVKAFWDSLPDNVKWNKAGDDEDTRKNIIQLAELLSFLRVEVPSWHDRDGTYLETPVKEDYLRASKHLYNLACGHSFIFGRSHITKDDLSLVVKVALDSAPKERTSLFKALIKNNGVLNTGEVVQATGHSIPIALLEMKKLDKVGLVKYSEESEPFTIKINPKFVRVLEILSEPKVEQLKENQL